MSFDRYNGGGYRNSGYSRRNDSGNGGRAFADNRGYNRGLWPPVGNKKKHSGARTCISSKPGHEGQIFISAWNFSREKGLVKVFVSPYKGTRDVQSGSGRTWRVMMAKLSFGRSGQEKIEPVLMDVQSGKVVIKSMGWVVNPRARNGGYCGSFSRRN